MKKIIVRWLVPIFAIVLLIGLVGCDSSSHTNQEGSKSMANKSENVVAGMPQGFPKEIPIYTGAQVIEADNFNGNNYTILYSVDADYDKIVDFYVDTFNLDKSGVGETESYFEGVDFGDVFIKGLTIEETGDAVNVYMTLRNDGQEISEEDNSASEYTDSNVMTYDTAEVVNLDKNYPQDVVPIYPDAKVIGCSMVPGKSSGFVDLLLPADAFEDAVLYYTDELGLKAEKNNTSVQKAVQFKGEIDNIKVAVSISHLLNTGNDPFVQITLNEK